VGHPRTPWSVKFHPTDPRYVASGCLGFQVRYVAVHLHGRRNKRRDLFASYLCSFWDIETGRCLYVYTLRHAIISISFHPSGDILAIASGTCVYTWDYQHTCPRIAMFSYQTLRSVTFLPDPTKIMVGEANERYMRPVGQNGQALPADLTVTLTMWDFDSAWALAPQPLENTKAMENGRIILSHALIYNDGGFDISRCGRYLAICADFSLRQAEIDSELEAASDVQQILSTAPQDPVGVEATANDEDGAIPVRGLQPVVAADVAMPGPPPSSASMILPPFPSLPVQSRTFPPAPFLQHHNMLAVLQTATNEPPMTMDSYMNQHMRRVRPRLHPSVERQPPARSARTSPVPVSAVVPPPQRYSTQIRPNIAVSRTRHSRMQRTQRSRLAAQVQSTWLALISLDSDQLGRVIQTCHLEETTAGGVTSVKLSPTSAYVLLGYGVRDRGPREAEFPVHRVTRIYRWENMELCSHVESELDDVNIALFSPICGGGFLYGTKQGKLRVCSTYRGFYDDAGNCNVLRETSNDSEMRHSEDDHEEDPEDDGEDDEGEDDDGDEMDAEEDSGDDAHHGHGRATRTHRRQPRHARQ
jgi:activating molecule in BECN1-regulated autophagy protein 1